MHIVAIVVFEGVDLFDFFTPCEVFRSARLPDGTAPYQVRVCATKPRIDAGSFAICAEHSMAGLSAADTVIVPGVEDPAPPPPPALVAAVRAAAGRGARLVPIRTGAFVLAEAGLLNGRRATTHRLAGGAAALDICLHMVRLDHGATVAADLARRFVISLEREDGRSPFIGHQLAVVGGSSLEPVLRWAEEHLDENLSNETLARRAIMSARTLARRFQQQVGTSPAHWVTGARIRRALELLESTDVPVARVAETVGFGSPATFRARFREAVGTSPQGYRRAFRQPRDQARRPGGDPPALRARTESCLAGWAGNPGWAGGRQPVPPRSSGVRAHGYFSARPLFLKSSIVQGESSTTS